MRLGGAFTLLLVSLGACIVEQRDYDEHLDRCTEYCGLVERQCTGENEVYDYPEACMSVCSRMDLGQPALGKSDGNTVACRIELLNGSEFTPDDCRKVGPGGGDACGSDCEAFCALRQQACTGVANQTYEDDLDPEKCLANCKAVPDLKSFDAGGRDQFGDSIQCRLVHVSEASVSPERAAVHCPHTQTVPKGVTPFPCSDDDKLSVDDNCDRYCEQVTGACSGEFAVYKDEQQCQAVCHVLDPGVPGDEKQNTVRCRRFHSYNALDEGPSIHCTHAGPTGDGHCGTNNCESYCTILSKACDTEFKAAFAGADAAARLLDCQSDMQCGKLEGHSADAFQTPSNGTRYRVDQAPQGNNLLCRTYHAVTALASFAKLGSEDAMECAAAFGAAQCAP